MVMEVLQEDMGESTMQYTNHPFKSTTINPGGICAFCLQEKLRKLVSSSFPIPFFPSSSSSPSPSFRSDYVTTTTITSSRTLSVRQKASTNPNTNTNNNGCHYHHYQSKRTRIPFFLTQKKKPRHGLTCGLLFKQQIHHHHGGEAISWATHEHSGRGLRSFLPLEAI
ncbi:hypothetical protein LOK49_LG06G03287 [Camellia lanceoleosa]|uniref:Uncharacterized protein n=1 Tax=Camellia lanceoleosa TaxID=1840588 RepID=A0ACC0HAV2_9ERIC|nr:hypothetical protein LOK49_LG06G03287 [Camellia lanceoleosa]